MGNGRGKGEGKKALRLEGKIEVKKLLEVIRLERIKVKGRKGGEGVVNADGEELDELPVFMSEADAAGGAVIN